MPRKQPPFAIKCRPNGPTNSLTAVTANTVEELVEAWNKTWWSGDCKLDPALDVEKQVWGMHPFICAKFERA